LTLYPRG